MRKSYVTLSTLLLPLQVGSNTGVSDEGNGDMEPVGAEDGAYGESIDMNTGQFD